MFTRKRHFIINPRSAGGYTGKGWAELEAAIQRTLGPFTYEFTDAPGSATKLAARAIKNGVDLIVVVGGDGTVSEAVNGYFAAGLPKSKPPLAILNRGTGGDLCRSLGAPADLSLALETIKNGRDISVDAGKLSYVDNTGAPATRYFINVAGCGLAGQVVHAVNQSSKRFGGLSYFLYAGSSALGYKRKPVALTWDDGRRTEHSIITCAIANGQFFGGGMQIAPNAQLGDGLFDVVILADWNLAQSMWYSKNLYNGTIASVKGVTIRRTRSVKIEPLDPADRILIDCDGEDVGIAPLTAEVMPGKLKFRI